MSFERVLNEMMGLTSRLLLSPGASVPFGMVCWYYISLYEFYIDRKQAKFSTDFTGYAPAGMDTQINRLRTPGYHLA